MKSVDDFLKDFNEQEEENNNPVEKKIKKAQINLNGNNKKSQKSQKSQKSGEWVKTDWGWRWEGEKDKDGRPIIRKETEAATMYHIDRPEWSWEEGDGKNSKQYNVWCVKFKKSGKEYYGYKKDGKFNQVRFVKKPFDLANRLYITGHAYQQKGQGDGDK